MIYFMQRADGRIKIGLTTDLRSRIIALSYEHGALEILGVCDGDRIEEKRLHSLFQPDSVGHEWFRPSPSLIAYIKANSQASDIVITTSDKRRKRCQPAWELRLAEKYNGNAETIILRLLNQIGMTELAKEAGVSITTLMHWCNKHKIDRFPVYGTPKELERRYGIHL